MDDLKLKRNEGILLITTEAWRYFDDNELAVDTLYLTNQNLISVYKKSNGIFSKRESVIDKIPLTSISIINDVVQVKKVKDDDYGETLQIIFDDGKKELLEFTESPKKEYQQWEIAISNAVLECNGKRNTDNQDETIVQNSPVAEINETVYLNTKETRFCSFCGTKLDPGARFCKSCGTPLETVSQPKQTEESCKEKPHQQSTYSERRQEFAGKIIKCPNCGEVLKSFVANCPSCGFELRGTKATSSVREFALKLEAIESRRSISEGKKHSFIAKIYGSDGKLTDTDEQKISLIRSFSVPNTKEDVLEFMILASSNVDVSIYGWGDKGVITESRKAVSEAWIAKMEQVYEKAKLTFGNAPEFQNIEKSYLKKVMEVKKRKRGIWLAIAGLYGGLLGLSGLIVLIVALMPEPTLEKQIENRQKHLEFVVDQIEDDIANGKFTDARNKTYTLTFDEELDSERHNYWKQKQQDILEQIEKASGEKAD